MWSRSLLINDIAIVKLYKPVSPSRVLKMCNDSHARDNIAVCGLGRTIPDVKNSWSVRLLETHIQENRSCIFNNEIDQSKTVCIGCLRFLYATHILVLNQILENASQHQ